MVINDLSGLLSGGLIISAAIAVLMTAATLLLLRDVGILERKLRGLQRPSDNGTPSLDQTEASVVEAKTRFLATVSHEMRTPMNGVLGMADLLAATRIDAEQRTYIDAIKSSGEAMLALIDEILDFSKINAGKLELAAEAFEITPLCESVAELLAPRAHSKGIEIAVYVAPDVPVSITSDPARFRQVLINLAGNAIKFTDAGGVGIRIEMTASDRLAVSVIDSGVGIAADRLQAIFEDFEQADGSSSRRFGGTGLGLSISKRIVEGLGGTITVESTPGLGSHFRFELPVSSSSKTIQRDQGEWPDLSGKSFLLVSKSRFETSFVGEYLQDAGAKVCSINNIALAKAEFDEANKLHGVIIDCALGNAETRAMAESAASAGIPIRFVMLSPYERRSLGSPGAAGFNGYLVKPLRARSLFARLREEPVSQSDAPEPAKLPGQVRLGLKVLLAEDNEINALLAMRLLQRYGCEAVWTTDGLAAVAAFTAAIDERTPFDALLLDVRMPGIDGLEAARRIRGHERHNGLAATRLIALTANAFAADQQNCLDAGFDSFLAKPVSQARLIEALTVTLGRQALARQTA